MMGSTRYAAQAEIARQGKLSAEMAKLQASISSGKRLSDPSDDPAAASRISEIRQAQSNQAIWTRNAGTGSSISTAVDDKLVSIQSALDRAKELILAGRSDATGPTDRNAMAIELRGIVADLADYAQSTDPTGRALFPATPPLAIPVSGTLSLTATDTRANVFDNVTTSAGTKTLAAILTDAANALAIGDITLRGAAATTSIAEIDAALGHLNEVKTDQGLRGQRFDAAATRLDNDDGSLSIERQGLENVDTAYAFATYTAKDTALKAAQTVYAQSHKNSLFDMLG